MAPALAQLALERAAFAPRGTIGVATWAGAAPPHGCGHRDWCGSWQSATSSLCRGPGRAGGRFEPTAFPGAAHGKPLSPEEEYQQAVAQNEAKKAAVKAKIEVQDQIYSQERAVEKQHNDVEKGIDQQIGKGTHRLTEQQEELVKKEAGAQKAQEAAIAKEAESLKEKRRLLKELEALENFNFNMRKPRLPMVSAEEDEDASPSLGGTTAVGLLVAKGSSTPSRAPWWEEIETQARTPAPKGPVIEIKPLAKVTESPPPGEVDKNIVEAPPGGSPEESGGATAGGDVAADAGIQEGRLPLLAVVVVPPLPARPRSWHDGGLRFRSLGEAFL